MSGESDVVPVAEHTDHDATKYAGLGLFRGRAQAPLTTVVGMLGCREVGRGRVRERTA